MKDIEPFSYRRAKGIVWVCDISSSSSYLNDNQSVDDIEAFLPRLYFVSKTLIECFGGKFIKWTGDGFLAFFEFNLDREKQSVAKSVYSAAEHLTLMCNITQLGLTPQKKFKIRHGITYEKDALVISIKDAKEETSFDIIGRSVVLAFRLSSIPAKYPSIVTIKELLEDTKKFSRWQPNKTDKLKFFKGESLGTNSIFVSDSNKKPKKIRNLKRFIKETKITISTVESPPKNEDGPIDKFVKILMNGPEWCQQVAQAEADFVLNSLLPSLKQITEILEQKHLEERNKKSQK